MYFGNVNFGSALPAFKPVPGESPQLTDLRRQLYAVDQVIQTIKDGFATDQQVKQFPDLRAQHDGFVLAIAQQIKVDAQQVYDAFNTNQTATVVRGAKRDVSGGAGFTVATPISVSSALTPATNGNTPSGTGSTSLTVTTPPIPSLNPAMQADADARAQAQREWQAKQDAIAQAQHEADVAAANAASQAQAAAAKAEQDRLAAIAAAHSNDPAAPSGFLGVLAGAGAGFLVGGPIGAAVGGALGAFFKK